MINYKGVRFRLPKAQATAFGTGDIRESDSPSIAKRTNPDEGIVLSVCECGFFCFRSKNDYQNF